MFFLSLDILGRLSGSPPCPLSRANPGLCVKAVISLVGLAANDQTLAIFFTAYAHVVKTFFVPSTFPSTVSPNRMEHRATLVEGSG